MALAQASGDDDDAAIGLRKVMHDDIFVHDGGSVTYCPVAGSYFAAFTMTLSSSDWADWGYIFEIEPRDAGIRAQIRVARALWDAELSGMYRATPLASIAGEGRSFPFGVEADSGGAGTARRR